MQYLSAAWQTIDAVGTLSTTREGGVSHPPYESLNLGLHVGDNIQHVLRNRACVSSHLPKPAVWLNQVHSAHVVTVDKDFDINKTIDADALYTQLHNQPLAIMTADCLPLLLTSHDGSEVAAIHGGWRGLEQGIIKNTLRCFKAERRNIHAWLGPAIGPNKFEVGDDVVKLFSSKIPVLEAAFTQQKNRKYLANIYSIASLLLQQQGIIHVSGGGYCTVSDAEKFFSYRRDGQTGRMVSLIWRK